MEEDIEPITAQARAQYEFAREQGILVWQYHRGWDELTDEERLIWERMAAHGFEAYWRVREAKEQTMPAITGRHRNGGLYKDGKGNFHSPEAEQAYYGQQHAG